VPGDQARSSLEQGDLDDLPGMDARAINGATEQLPALDHPSARIEENQSEHLIVQMSTRAVRYSPTFAGD